MAGKLSDAAWIKCFKTVDGALTACEIDDPEATYFNVHWVGAKYSTTAIDAGSKYRAEWIVIAINDVYAAGKRHAFQELRDLIGVKN